MSIFEKTEELLANAKQKNLTEDHIFYDLVIILVSCRNMKNSDGTKCMEISDIRRFRNTLVSEIEINYPGFTRTFFDDDTPDNCIRT